MPTLIATTTTDTTRAECQFWAPYRVPRLPHAHACDRPNDHAAAERHHCPLCGRLWTKAGRRNAGGESSKP